MNIFFYTTCMCHEKYSIFYFFFTYIYSTEHTKFFFLEVLLFLSFNFFFASRTTLKTHQSRELSYTPRRRRLRRLRRWRRRWEFTILIIIYFTWNHTFNARNQTRLNLSLCRKYKSFIQMSLLSPYYYYICTQLS